MASSDVCEAEEPRLTLQPTTIDARNGTTTAAEIGELVVPARHAHPEGGQISIAFIRVRSVAADPGPPTFILAGGPGDSGVRIVRQMFAGNPDQIRAVLRGDIIGVDQRGTGGSQPNLEIDDRYGFDLTAPGDPQAYATQIEETCRAVAQRLRRAGTDLSAFNTVESADDINMLRDALAYNTMNLWGVSYGSHLGLTILRRHEPHVERLMIASPEGPDHTFKRPAHVTDCLERLYADRPDMMSRMNRVIARLEQESVEVTVPHPRGLAPVSIGISAFDIRLWTWFALSRVETAEQLPAVYEAMDSGDFSVPARFLASYRLQADVGSAMKHAMDAYSGASDERRRLIAEESPECLLGDVINFPAVYLDFASIWGAADSSREFRRPVVSSQPVLIICGEFDIRTPIQNAHEIQRHLSNSSLVITRGEGHGLRPSREVLAVIGDFFRGEPLPRVQTIGRR